MSALVDEKYYRQTPDESLAERLMMTARDRIYKDFHRSDEASTLRPHPGRRSFRRDRQWCQRAGAEVSVSAKYHRLRARDRRRVCAQPFRKSNTCRSSSNVRLPFEDKKLPDRRRERCSRSMSEALRTRHFFVQELCRVAERVYISVPNKFFPIEHHTALPLVHFEKRAFKIACAAAGKSEWTDEKKPDSGHAQIAVAIGGPARAECRGGLYRRTARTVLLEPVSRPALAPADRHGGCHPFVPCFF